jgi:oligogalacturonide lyase
MAKGDSLQFDFLEYRDPSTGARVVRLTPPGAACFRNYFYQKCFSRDGKRLIFGFELGGETNLWMLELDGGRATQLSQGGGANYQGAYLSADDRFIFFTRGRARHLRIDLGSLEETIVYEVPPGWIGAGTWAPNTPCTRVAGMEMLASDRVRGFQGWERFRREYEARPLERLIDIDLATGIARVVLEERRYLGHPSFRPFHDDTMCFCHEGPHDLVDARIWLVDRDGSNLRKVKEHAPGESCMHEFWAPDGSRLYYVSYMKGERERHIRAVDPESLRDERIMSMPPCAHLMSDPDGRRLVGDGAGQLGDVADAPGYAFEPDRFIHLFDLGSRTHRPLCEHNSSWAVRKGNTQAAHPHPSFAPDGERVLFASDFEGYPALYVAESPR